MSKRKADTHRNNTKIRNTSPQSSELELDRSLFIQAHEADIIRGPRGHAAALALQVRIVDDQEIVGEGLIRWGAEPEGTRYRYEGEDDSHSRAAATEEGKDTAIWVDRYAEFLHICNMVSCVHERNKQHLTIIHCLTIE